MQSEYSQHIIPHFSSSYPTTTTTTTALPVFIVIVAVVVVEIVVVVELPASGGREKEIRPSNSQSNQFNSAFLLRLLRPLQVLTHPFPRFPAQFSGVDRSLSLPYPRRMPASSFPPTRDLSALSGVGYVSLAYS